MSIVVKQRPLLKVRPIKRPIRLAGNILILPEHIAHWIAYRFYWPKPVTINREIKLEPHGWDCVTLYCDFESCDNEDFNWEIAEEIAAEYSRQVRRVMNVAWVNFGETDEYVVENLE